VPVEVLEGVQNLIAPLQNLTGRERPSAALQELVKVLAGHEVHDEEVAAALREEVDDDGQRRVAERIEELGLAREGAGEQGHRHQSLSRLRPNSAKSLRRRTGNRSTSSAAASDW
jgi:hypothetical protein